MAFGDFDLKTVNERFGLTVDERSDLFSAIPPALLSARLRETLDQWAPAALAMNTEKARSEMIIAPILMEATSLLGGRVTLFSGVAFDVDRERGLNGICDFLLTRSPERFFVSRPVMALVEAKREDIAGGLGQCAAAMVAARIFNERDGGMPGPVFGAVTTGNIWRFLKLDGSKLLIDLPEYYLDQVDRVLGILISIAS
jgi:hypothetical protein